MRRARVISAILLSLSLSLSARQNISVCGTTRETPGETRFLHRQSARARGIAPVAPGARAIGAAVASGNRDLGDIAVIEDAGGIVARQNEFNLDHNSLTFTPSTPDAARYRYSAGPQGYDDAAAEAGAPFTGIGDDDTRRIALPFAFPFFGAVHRQVFVNSDGNLTFITADIASTDRSLGRMTAGPPRISPLFDDLDPVKTVGGVRLFSDASRLVVSWVRVPEWQQNGIGAAQTFQVTLYPDGRIGFSYSGTAPSSAVVGIAPGNLQGSSALIDFRNDPSSEYSAAVAERFGNTLAIDLVTLGQKFYETHEDSYDYLVVYNAMGIPAMSGAVAFESTVRSGGSGYGVEARDSGREFGSASRLQAVINMGPLAQYPADPNGVVAARQSAGDTPLTVLGHETGHLFLAFASVRDPNDPSARPMLNTDLAHWSFVFNSDASLVEGERIADRGVMVAPEFVTGGTVEHYSALDQYLMGFIPAEEVPPTFLVAGAPAYMLAWHPIRGIAFDGTRSDVAADAIVRAEGRRTPDHTVAQRRFRLGFILLISQASEAAASDVSQVDAYRRQFEDFYARAASYHAAADTSLKRSMKLSLSPAAGLLQGASATAALSLETVPASDMTVLLQAPNGNAAVPASITVPAGVKSASFPISGIATGVEELSASPAESLYETAAARIQVADAAMLKLVTVSGDHQRPATYVPLPDPIVVRLTDANNLPYPGARIVAQPSSDGIAVPSEALTDAEGKAWFRWTPGLGRANQLLLYLDGSPAVRATVHADRASRALHE